jgi:hypothetical protein
MFIKNEKIFLKLRFLTIVVFPAFITCFNTIAIVWHVPYTKEITATLTAIEAFLGAILETSNKIYRDSKRGDINAI